MTLKLKSTFKDKQMFIIKQNDTSPAIQVKLRTPQNQAVNLIGASVKFHMKHESGTLKISSDAIVVDEAGTAFRTYVIEDTDTFQLDPALLLAGLRWKWKYEKHRCG